MLKQLTNYHYAKMKFSNTLYFGIKFRIEADSNCNLICMIKTKADILYSMLFDSTNTMIIDSTKTFLYL